MSGVLGDVLDTMKLCQKLYSLIADLRNAPMEYQSSVYSIMSIHGAFKCIQEELQNSSSAQSTDMVAGNTEMRHRLAGEIAGVKTLLKEAEDILQQYASGANSRGIRGQWKKVQWRYKRPGFEKCLRKVRERFIYIITLIGVNQLSLNQKLQESVAALNLHLNDRPPAIGLPGSGGVPQDHVRFRDGLGRKTYLLLDLCPSPQRLEGFLKVMFDGLPGRQHVEEHHYRLYCNSNSHHPQELTQDSWPYLVGSGCSIFLAFVVGTWQMNTINLCPMCGLRNGVGWNLWHDCRCGCFYFVSEAGEVDYEPRDGHWLGESQDLQHWKDSKQQAQMDARDDMSSAFRQHHEETEGGSDINSFGQDHDEEHYFRCMLMVFDPVWNFVCRNVFCRCVLGAISSTSKAPEIDILTTMPCPNHSPPHIRANPNAYSPMLQKRTYDEDRYFERFGGYKNFTQIARYLNEGTIAMMFVDIDKLCPEKDQDESTMTELFKAHPKVALRYRWEILPKLQFHWQEHMKVKYEKLDSDFVLDVERWMTEEQDDLAKQSASVETSSNTSSYISSLAQKGGMTPCLWKGRLTLETVETFSRLDRTVVVWP